MTDEPLTTLDANGNLEKPFLTVVTRSFMRAGAPARPVMLERCEASLRVQQGGDYQHLIVWDHEGLGAEGSHRLIVASADEVEGDYVLILDDDDALSDPVAILALKQAVAMQDRPDVVMFRVLRFGQPFPPAEYWGKPPVPGQVCTCSYVVKTEVWKRHIHELRADHYEGDFALIHALFEHGYRVFWYDVILAEVSQIGRGQPE